MMTSAAATRFFICECLVVIASMGSAGAQTATYDLRLGAGWVSNPFYDDADLQAIAPIAGPVGRFGVSGSLDWPLAGAHALVLDAGLSGDRFSGDADALRHQERLGVGWRWTGTSLEVGAMIQARFDAIDRFATDDRLSAQVGPQIAWAPLDWVRLETELIYGVRYFPERTDVEADGSAQLDDRRAVRLLGLLGPAPVGATRWWLELEGSAWLIDSNADALDRDTLGGGAQLIGDWRRLSWDVGVGGWALDLPEQPRADRGLYFGGGLGVRLSEGWLLRADAQRVDSDSDAVAGRFSNWQSGLTFIYRDRWKATSSRIAAGITRLADGRWRFATRQRGTTVALVGDFNGWRPDAARMHQEGDTWIVDVELPRGRQTFMFFVDGRFVSPSFGPLIDDGFGRQVGVMWVQS